MTGTPAPSLDELLALDLRTLVDHTERAGDGLEPVAHAARLRAALTVSTTCAVRRGSQLVAYAMLSPVDTSTWFVRGFCVHPAHRGGPALRDLLRQVTALVRREGIVELRSHVYRTNDASLAFHRGLGAEVARESDKAIEFVVRAGALRRRAFANR